MFKKNLYIFVILIIFIKKFIAHAYIKLSNIKPFNQMTVLYDNQYLYIINFIKVHY